MSCPSASREAGKTLVAKLSKGWKKPRVSHRKRASRREADMRVGGVPDTCVAGNGDLGLEGGTPAVAKGLGAESRRAVQPRPGRNAAPSRAFGRCARAEEVFVKVLWVQPTGQAGTRRVSEAPQFWLPRMTWPR